MNIFFLDNDVEKNAMLYHDAHVRKIIVEIAQMLSTAHSLLDSNEKNKAKLYKPTHANHPMTKWVRESRGNYCYTLEILKQLCKEFEYRFDKKHKTSELIPYLSNIPRGLMNPMHTCSNIIWNTTPPLCMPEKYKCDDFIQAYRRYYIGEKQYDKNGKPHKWTKRDKPEFILNAEKDAKSIIERCKKYYRKCKRVFTK
ncbi:MAG: hypothetical protein EOL97_11110 [Spirochaetia bacterium]|nr:hypothetical protein [Spirochaetia bacterium]